MIVDDAMLEADWIGDAQGKQELPGRGAEHDAESLMFGETDDAVLDRGNKPGMVGRRLPVDQLAAPEWRDGHGAAAKQPATIADPEDAGAHGEGLRAPT